MSEWVVVVPPGLSRTLARDFELGLIINDTGHRIVVEHEAGRLEGLKIEIFANETPPPRIRVSFSGQTVSFAIDDSAELEGGLSQWARNIRKWHAAHKRELIEVWNRTRPENCPVGPRLE